MNAAEKEDEQHQQRRPKKAEDIASWIIRPTYARPTATLAPPVVRTERLAVARDAVGPAGGPAVAGEAERRRIETFLAHKNAVRAPYSCYNVVLMNGSSPVYTYCFDMEPAQIRRHYPGFRVLLGDANPV